MNLKTKFLNLFRSLFKFQAIENVIIEIIKSNTIFSKFGKKLVPSNYLYKKNSRRKCTVNGVNLDLDISDYVNHFVYFNLEEHGFDELLYLATKSRIVFDVGANIGFTALSMAKVINKNGEIHAFEPDPYNFARLQSNLALNPNNTVSIQNLGFGDIEGKLKLIVNTQDNLGGNRIDENAQGDYTLVDITTVDSYCKKNRIEIVDLIKIDVEGFEYNVLKGAEFLLTNSKPKLFIEIDDKNLKLQGTSAHELISFLESMYNNLYVADTKAHVTSQDDFRNCHFDMVAKYED